jgi:energy-coupling factor transporter ATP-binding protein EcfA2
MLVTNEIGDDAFKLTGLTPLSMIVGRNGSGKSQFLRGMSGVLTPSANYSVRYVSPERAGTFRREAGVDDAIRNNPTWLQGSRLKNQVSNFKTASASLLNRVERTFLLRVQNDPEVRASDATFQSAQLSKINRLLTNVEIVADDEFTMRTLDGDVVSADNISSGESEAMALATEILDFINSLDPERFNLLLLDEPDVHMHPDLQARFARFLLDELSELTPEMAQRTAVVIATHSTSMICEFATSDRCSVGTKYFGKNTVTQRPIAENLRKVSPFFGHPLSKSLSDDTLLIVEGEDDERIWQQAGRTAGGKIHLYPCLAITVNQQADLERFCADWLGALYDKPLAISLRDGDGKSETLDDIGPVRRFRLACYEAENLLLTDECLQVLGCDWAAFCEKAKVWLEANMKDKRAALVSDLIKAEDRLRHVKLKPIRDVICRIAESGKPWENVVGRAIGLYSLPAAPVPKFSLADFIGSDALALLLA